MFPSTIRSRRVIAAGTALLCALVLVTASFVITQPQSRAASASVQTQVSSSVQWVNTGITLSVGETLMVSATGSWSTDVNLFPNVGPDGYTQQAADNFLNLTDLGACSTCASTQTPHWGALIGYIGNNPPAAGSYTSTSILPEAQKVFVVGSNFQSGAPFAGTLWLNFNDDAYSANTGDNAGQVTATVTDTPTSPVTQWQSPQNSFYNQGDHVTLSVSVTSGASQITGVTFTASWDSNTNVSICNGGLTGGKWVCQWAMKYNKSFVRNGTITFGYTVKTATQTIVNPSGTRSGTIVYELTDDNPIYAGYSTASQSDTVTYTMVVAKWTVPKATCGFGEVSKSAIWAGIAGKTQLAQIATESNCNLGKPKYIAQWEVIPLITPAQTINKTVSSGDKMVATVTYVSKNNTFNLTLVDSGKWTVPITTHALASSSERTHGECVVEAPSAANNGFIYPLTNFGTVSLDCQVNSKPVANGPENIKFVMVSNVQKALTNPLATNGEVFTVVWKHA